MADATKVETTENTDQNQNTEHVQVPDDHPLVKTLAKLREEMASLKAKSDESAKKIVEANQPSTLDGELTAAKAELAKAKLALKYGLSETDSALLPAGEAGEALAKRLAETTKANGGLPVIQNLGNKTGLKTDDAEEAAAKFLGQLLKP